MTDVREKIRQEVSKLHTDVLYSSKGHYYAAGMWKWVHYILGGVSIALGACLAREMSLFGLTIAEMGGIVVVCSALQTFLNTKKTERSHFVSGVKYNTLQVRARRFASIDCDADSGIDVGTLRSAMEKMYQEKSELDLKSEKISKLAYLLAKRGIANGEASYGDETE